MKEFWHKYSAIILCLSFLTAAIWREYYLLNSLTIEKSIERTAEVLDFKEKQLQTAFYKVIERLDDSLLWDVGEIEKLAKNGLALCVYEDNQLRYWTSSKVAFNSEISDDSLNPGMKRLPTGWYYIDYKKEGTYTIVGYILVKQSYTYSNKYLKESFQKDFNLPSNAIIEINGSGEGKDVISSDGSFLFKVNYDGGYVCSEKSIHLVAVLYLMAIIIFLWKTLTWLEGRRYLNGGVKTLSGILIGFGIYIFFNRFNKPEAFYLLRFFSPDYFAAGSWLSSLGEFAIVSLLMLYVAFVFFRCYTDKDMQKSDKSPAKAAFPFLFLGLYFALSIYLFRVLLSNSDITFDFYSELHVLIPNLIGLLGVTFQVFGFLFIVLRLRTVCRKCLTIHQYIIGCAGTLVVVSLSYIISDHDFAWYPVLFFISIMAIPVFVSFENLRKYKTTFLVIFSMLVAFYFISFLYWQLERRNRESQKLIASNLASEREPAAEIFLTEFESKIKEDTVIANFLIPPYDIFEEYLQKNYFGGFWRNYDVQITICGKGDKIHVLPDDEWHDCNLFFSRKLESSGVRIPGTEFYFIDEPDGLTSYLGNLRFESALGEDSLSVYIDIISKPVPEGQGYPELLLDETASGGGMQNIFSYAKYYKNQLVYRRGEYQYDLTLKTESDQEDEYIFYVKNNYVHCRYHPTKDNYIIVSAPFFSFIDRLKSFPYLFLVIYLTGFVFMGINTRGLKLRRSQWDFRKKIQFSMVSLLLGSLIIVGGGIISYNYIQFKRNIKNELNEKIRSVSAELSMRMGDEIEFNKDWGNFLDYELIQLSDIHWVDINLFTTTGELLATSRYDIYNRGLTAPRMNPYAYNAMEVEGDVHFLHHEKLGNMSFYSAYVPVYNNENEVEGFLNIPYITKQSKLMEEISGFIVAFLNLYILLTFISLIIAVFISKALTSPLRVVEESIRNIQFGKSTDKIEYYGEDEIGQLVNEYNKKVDELAESAKLLARSERESAWREMARQVAHEIKNPLTPMKLSIQYLQHLKDKEIKHFDVYFKEVTGTLIEQVETLSSIASAFSSFATMPKTKNEKIDLCERLKEVVLLFETNDNVDIGFSKEMSCPVYVNADKDQVKRAFINLVKNGIQSVPADRKGKIDISVKTSQDSVTISFSDNGTGIDDELKDKLFEPNFTTKTSGMGLGLAITKSIIETSGGKIWFETSLGKGTTFFVELPLFREE